MVNAATINSGVSTPSSAAASTPKTSWSTRTIPNTPALTTATAWSSAETGAGATIASGSQPCSGNSAALTPSPPTSSTKISSAGTG